MNLPVSLVLCLFAFALCFWAGRKSLVNGLIAVLAVGYAYGITRANIPETYSHFIFDAGVIALYASQFWHRLSAGEQYRVRDLRPWLEFLVAWPLLLFLIPIQDYLVQVVGLRGNIFLLPFIFLGARLDGDDRYRLALWIAGLNVAAFAVAGAEYVIGLEQFFPRNKVTELIYLSNDLVQRTQFRIPSSFVNAHAYGGTMVITLPFLAGAIIQKRRTNFELYLIGMGIAAALLGVLMSATRTHFLVAAILVTVATFSLRSRLGYVFGWLILIIAIGWAISGEQRLQGFMRLRDTDAVAERISWSVNMNFFEIAAKYPFGNGLGGGGTSIPYFLQGRISDPVMMENEYARIMLEQGIVGLLIWIAFVVWVLSLSDKAPNDSWHLGRRLARVACMVSFATGLTGIGLMTSVPHTSLFLLLVGWIGARQPAPVTAEASPQQVNLDPASAYDPHPAHR